MSNLLLIPSLLGIAAALGLRWWFAIRILADLSAPEREAAVLLRKQALDHWRTTDRRAAASRAGTLRFGLATPPLSLLVALFAILVGKIQVLPALAIVLAITAIASALGILTLPAELAAIQRFKTDAPVSDAVRRAALAEAWNQAIPPALRSLFPG